MDSPSTPSDKPTAQQAIRERHDLIGSDRVQGTRVYRKSGEKIGHIERVMIDKHTGQVVYAVMNFGGFLGLGEDSYPLPWSMLTYDAKRPAGLTAFIGAFDMARLDLGRLREFERPVYFALGGLSNPDYYGRMAERLGRIFRDFTLETYPERHHFDPPHRVESAKVAAALRRLWLRAEPHPT